MTNASLRTKPQGSPSHFQSVRPHAYYDLLLLFVVMRRLYDISIPERDEGIVYCTILRIIASSPHKSKTHLVPPSIVLTTYCVFESRDIRGLIGSRLDGTSDRSFE
jgi:hypothetical protein